MAEEATDKSGTVYILRNEAMPGIIKMGKTGSDLKQRLRELNNTSVPLPFECYFAKKVGDMHFVERRLFAAFADSRVSPHREFFWVSPEQAKAALEIAPGEVITVDESSIVPIPGDIESLEKAKARRPPFRFSMVGIRPGQELTFKDRPDVKCIVVDDTDVRFADRVMSVTLAAGVVLTEMGQSPNVNGTLYWTKDGSTLAALRSQAESSIRE